MALFDIVIEPIQQTLTSHLDEPSDNGTSSTEALGDATVPGTMATTDGTPDSMSSLIADNANPRIHPFFRNGQGKEANTTNEVASMKLVDATAVSKQGKLKEETREEKKPRKPRTKKAKKEAEPVIAISFDAIAQRDTVSTSNSVNNDTHLPSPTSIRGIEGLEDESIDPNSSRRKRRKLSTEPTLDPCTPQSSERDMQLRQPIEISSSPPRMIDLPAIQVPASSLLPTLLPQDRPRPGFVDLLSSELAITKSEPNQDTPCETVVEKPPLAPLFKKSKRRSKSPGESQSTPPEHTIKVKRKYRSAKIAANDSIKLQLNPSPATVRIQTTEMLEKLPNLRSLLVKLKINGQKLQEGIDFRQAQSERRAQASDLPNKSLHPFFIRGAVKQINIPQTAETLSEDNAELIQSKAATSQAPVTKDAFLKFALSGPGSVNTLSRGGANPKWQQLMDPPWPAPGSIHVHGFDSDVQEFMSRTRALPWSSQQKSTGKAKFVPYTIQDNDSMINHLSNQLNKLFKTEIVDALQIPPSVRIPDRLELAASPLLKDHLKPALKTRLSSTNLHPAIRALRDRIACGESILAPVDKGECETQSWTAKYSPKAAAEVLQPRREALLLKEWLQRMKVWAVGRTNTKAKKAVIKKPKKKRPDGLDGFLISESEEDDLMDEITDPEDEVLMFPGTSIPSSNLKSVIRHGEMTVIRDADEDVIGVESQDKKLVNAVVISGPSGVGKTAAVYAAATEQGFSVFEINAGNKRGGKEVLEMVGEMSKNHLVHQSKVSDVKAPSNSFFKPKDNKPDIIATGTTATALPNLQQSLILIEEADLLYEEDKQFWPTILSLIAQSKRPVVITCNDEALLPMESLSLHGIFRFSRPSKDVVVDYLLLLAGAEGHSLTRRTVQSLYDECRGDLRKCIMQLDFWCQMAIGDRTGGTKWWIKRFPEGCDVDEDGEVLRLISKNTYCTGMGAFGRDMSYEREHLDPDGQVLEQAEIWRDVYESSGLDVGELLYENLHEEIGELVGRVVYTSAQKAQQLEHYYDYIDSLSAADVYSGHELRAGSVFEDYDSSCMILDPTMPPMPSKDVSDNILGRHILQVAPRLHTSHTSRSIGMYLRATSREFLYKRLRHGEGAGAIPESVHTNMDRITTMIAEKHIRPRPGTPLSQFQQRQPFTLLSQPSNFITSIPTVVHSQFLRPLSVFTTELMPYVREIARYDLQLEEERMAASNLLSAGGDGGKRKRTTRAAALATLGRGRGTGRAGSEKYLQGSAKEMVATAGAGWEEALKALMKVECPSREGSERPTNRQSSTETDEDGDVNMSNDYVQNCS